METRKDLVNEILKYNDKDVKQVNPLIFLIVEEVITILLEKCDLNLSTVNRPGIFQRWLLKRYISYANDKIISPQLNEAYYGANNDVYDWLLAYGKTLNVKSLRKAIYVGTN